MTTNDFRHLKKTNVILLCLLFLKYVQADSAWFQVCDTKQKYALNSVDCELGLWLDHPVTVDCVCVNGIWIISDDLCDTDAIIVVGKGDCFTIRKKIRSVKLLGDPEDPFGPATYVASETLDSVVEVPLHGYNEKLNTPNSVVISIYPKHNILRSDHEVCLGVSKQIGRKPVHIWRNSMRVSNRFRFIDKSRCESTHLYDLHVGFGEIYKGSEVQTGEAVVQNCASKCLSTPENRGRASSRIPGGGRGISGNKNRGAAPQGRGISNQDSSSTGSKYTRINWDGLYAVNQPIEFTGGESLPNLANDAKVNWYKFRWNITLPALSHSRETREQSVRMIQAQTNFLLLNQPPPKINTFEYNYFQAFRQIFLAVAPPDVISPYIVNGLMRMFRQLLWESHDKFEYRENTDTVQYDRIMKSLNECLYNVSQYPMFFTGALESEYSDKPPNSTHNCLNETVLVYRNDSGPSDPPGKVTFIARENDITHWNAGRTGTREVFDPAKFDFVIELAWKIFLFGSYRCTSYFEETMTDGHELAEKVMSLFNHRVIKRWYQSEDFNTLLPLIFPTLDTYTFARAVDRLAVVARYMTPNRPEYFANFLARKPIPMTAPDHPPFSERRFMNGYRHKRSSRRSKSKTDFFWNNKAHCLYSYSDPILKFKYSGKADCYV